MGGLAYGEAFIHRLVTGGIVRYHVRFVSDHSLPAEVTWAFAQQAGETYLFVKQSAIDVDTGRCDALSRAWAVWQDAENRSLGRSLARLSSVG